MKRFIALLLVLLSIAAMAGCTPSASAAANEVKYPKGIAYDNYDEQWRVREENPVSADTILRVNDFAFRSAAVLLAGTAGNANYSPLSLYYALALLAEGAEGDTRAELVAALCGDAAPTGDPGAELGNLMRCLYTDNEVAKLKIANAIWLRSGVSFGEAFCDTAAKDYYASLFTADFSDSATAKAISKWISDQTGGLLEPEITLTREQIMTIINTVYFKDQWFDEFRSEATADGTFHAASGDVTAAFMHATRSGQLVQGDGFVRASLPLKSAGYMTFVLPNEGTDMAALLGRSGLEALISGGEEALYEIEWAVPKFAFNSEFDLIPMLRTLGVQSAFQTDAALDGITADAYVSAIRQQTRIGIDEKGVEAAAFTEIAVNATGAFDPPHTAITLDRPFLFAVTADNGALLFLGIVGNPAA